MYTMGKNGVFNKASDAKLKTDIANWKEKLELAKGPVIIDRLGTFDPDKYFEYIESQEIIEDRNVDIVENEDETYDVTTKPGYIFQIELMPNKEKPTDAEITYLGQTGKMKPIIKQLEVSATSTSITAKAIVVKLGNGTVTYYYKLASAEESSYQEITSVNAKIGATQNTGIMAGEKYAIKVVAKNEIGEVSKTVEVTVMDENTAIWNNLNKMAKEIANDSNITNDSTQATVTIDGESKTISVGEIYKVKYGSEEKRVRVLGFKHDDLVNTGVYGGNHSKASISFEFVDRLGYHNMNGNTTNTNGWAVTEMRTFLEGSNGREKLDNNNHIKQVKKKYIKTYNDPSSVTTSNDYLWLLSCSEVMKDGYNEGDTRGYAITKEGEQYLYYRNNATEEYKVASANRIKYESGNAYDWWLRSPYYNNKSSFCYIYHTGYNNGSTSNTTNGVAPGFCI